MLNPKIFKKTRKMILRMTMKMKKTMVMILKMTVTKTFCQAMNSKMLKLKANLKTHSKWKAYQQVKSGLLHNSYCQMKKHWPKLLLFQRKQMKRIKKSLIKAKFLITEGPSHRLERFLCRKIPSGFQEWVMLNLQVIKIVEENLQP